MWLRLYIPGLYYTNYNVKKHGFQGLKNKFLGATAKLGNLEGMFGCQRVYFVSLTDMCYSHEDMFGSQIADFRSQRVGYGSFKIFGTRFFGTIISTMSWLWILIKVFRGSLELFVVISVIVNSQTG